MTEPDADGARTPDRPRQADRLGWGLFLLWLGVTLLFGVDWPLFLIGTGLITLAIQILRRSWHLPLEPFWVVVGIVFVAAGIWEGLGSTFPVVPTVLIIFGVAALFGAARGDRPPPQRHGPGDQSG